MLGFVLMGHVVYGPFIEDYLTIDNSFRSAVALCRDSKCSSPIPSLATRVAGGGDDPAAASLMLTPFAVAQFYTSNDVRNF